MSDTLHLSVNGRAADLVARLERDAAELKVGVRRGDSGERLIDAGSEHRGSIAAGLQIAEICMGGLGTVELTASEATPRWPWTLSVRSSNPVVACLGSQYAGWRLAHGEGKDAFFALGSGPARALARTEPLFETLAYRDEATSATLVMESARPPPTPVVAKVAQACGVEPSRLTFIYAPTQSLAGSVQVVARVLEVALHKAHELHFPLERIVDGMGAAPLAPPHPKFVTAMGRTNDAIIYGGRVHLFVIGPAADARELAERLPSQGSREYGRTFAQIFEHYKGDFYAIDPMLFSPAEVIVSAIETGESFRAGRIDRALLDASFA
ncbi:MAG TPA: methenyltetrahydromethanopterin cyclohydrolase [Xanthobacteraceae bacterium]|jgi:methenyltetrahydromethanopterin cyclohydrolase|nr:methenyltetrahydromethanopterin cyclohydrolase [Xanthobacteraceae bacterium]